MFSIYLDGSFCYLAVIKLGCVHIAFSSLLQVINRFDASYLSPCSKPTNIKLQLNEANRLDAT